MSANEKDGQNFSKDIRNGLQMATSKEDIAKWLKIIRIIMVPSNQQTNKINPSEMKDLGYDFSDVAGLRKVVKKHRKHLLELIISKFTVDWMSELTTEYYNVLVKPIFYEGPVKDAFLVLMKSITETGSKDYKFHMCVLLMEEFLTCQRLFLLLQELNEANLLSRNSTALGMEEELIVSLLTSLPEKLANILQLENSDAFLPQNYVPMLAHSILEVLQQTHDLLNKGQDVSLMVVSALVGKLCMAGRTDLFLDTLLPHLSAKVRSDFIWCRICERVFVGVPSRSVESVLVPLLRKISWYGLVDKFLGDCVVHNTTIQMLTCTKLLLHRHYSKPKQLLQNIIGYLSSFHTRRHLLMQVMLRLLQVWGDSSSMKHISTEQHIYISQALMTCIGVINETEKRKFKSDMLRHLMPGVQTHLESSDPKVRTVGMAVAKTLTHTIDPTGPQLEFELDSTDPVVADLMSYMKLPEDPGPTEAERTIALAAQEKASQKGIEQNMSTMNLEDKPSYRQQNMEEDLDSDDDLVPYDMSNDRKVSTAKPPKYIRDCMEGLICSSEDPDKTEVCLQHAEALIRKKTDGLSEIAAEFAKVLLHMQDTHSFENFLLNRFRSLVALTVMCPSQVAEYLTSQFYERNYSIRQRMDILEVLASAAQELSQPKSSEGLQQDKKPKIIEVIPDSEPSSWREIVQRRIESNTRRFARGRTRPEPQPTLNKFAPVAGQFFYPLMVKVDKSEPCLDLLEKDSALLFRLLYTLAIVLLSSMNIPTATQMGRTLLEFTWPLRLHPDPSVRQACLIATSSVFLVVPAFNLLADLHADVTETRAWLEDVVERDPDTECQKLAAQALLALQDQIKKEMENSSAANAL